MQKYRRTLSYIPTGMFLVNLKGEQFPEVKVVVKSEQISLKPGLMQDILLSLVHD